MERKIINPWKWQDQLGFVQANEVTGVNRMLVCAGQAAMSSEGVPLHAGDMKAQITLALDNLETVLKEAGLGWANVVRLNYYTTDVDLFFKEYAVAASRLVESGCRPASTLLGVTRLAFPELMIEVEATAVA
ncbi:MAG TPA: RidA family protein [Pyrinomonadaceae bacterium]|nr:RidA family protein [Pyrinomonadaceae bacterium]